MKSLSSQGTPKRSLWIIIGMVEFHHPNHKKTVKIPAHQFGYKLGYDIDYLVPISNSIPNNAISNNSKLLFDLKKDVIPQQFGNVFFILDISCASASVTCLPSPYMFSEVRFIQLPNNEITTWYPVSVIAFQYMTLS